jgi:aminopeptidase N
VQDRLLAAMSGGHAPVLDAALADALRALLDDATLDPALKAAVLRPPSEGVLAEQLASADPQRVHTVRQQWLAQLAEQLHGTWTALWERCQVTEGYAPVPAQTGRRQLANLALQLLTLHAVRTGDAVWQGRTYQRFKDAGNMTDRLAALVALVDSHSLLADTALERFHAQAQGDALVLDKWFMLQAGAEEPVPGVHQAAPGAAFARARSLLQHPAFSARNPNRARALLGTLFTANPGAFHRSDAAGYVLWADKVVEIDAFNGHVAARLARALDRWAHLAEPYRSAAREAIARVAARADLTPDTREVVTRALEQQP